MQDCWDTVECRIYAYSKQELRGGSILSVPPVATETKHIFLKHLDTACNHFKLGVSPSYVIMTVMRTALPTECKKQRRALKLQFACPITYHGVSSLS